MSIDAIDALLDHILLESEEDPRRVPQSLDVAVDMLLDGPAARRRHAAPPLPGDAASLTAPAA